MKNTSRRLGGGRIALSALALTVAAVVIGATNPGAIAARRTPQSSPYSLANRCFALYAPTARRYVALTRSGTYEAGALLRTRAIPLYLKPTGLGKYMLYDRRGGLVAERHDGVARVSKPGTGARWRIARAPRHTFALVSTADAKQLQANRRGVMRLVPRGSAGHAGRFVFQAEHGCRPFPEAKVGAFGRGRPSVTRGGKVFGWADLEFHLTASFRAGGEVIAGEDFDPFGVTAALSAARDKREHGPDGTEDTTGNLLRFGSPVGRTDIHGWPTFVGWPTYDTLTNQQAYWVWLERAWRSGMRLVIANTSEDVELCNLEPRRSHTCDEEGSIELQVQNLRALQSYIDAQFGGPGRGFFRLVNSPSQARRVIDEGKLAVVIGVESSNPFGCSEYQGKPQCTRVQVDHGLARWWKLGIRGFFPAHWVDNAFAGAALEGGSTGSFLDLLNVHQTGHPFKTGRCPLPGEGVATQPPSPISPNRKVCNVKSLTPLGAYAIKRMIGRHFMIFADHMSEWARERVLGIAARNHYPLVSSHTDIGGAWVPQDLRRLYALGGLATTTLDVAGHNVRRILQLAHYRSPRYYFGAAFGTDTGGFATLPAPDAAERALHYPFTEYNGVRFVRERTGKKVWDFNRDGVAQYGLMADLIGEMRRQRGHRAALPLLYRSAEAYLEAWQRAWLHR